MRRRLRAPFCNNLTNNLTNNKQSSLTFFLVFSCCFFIAATNGQLNLNSLTSTKPGCPPSLQCLPFLSDMKFDQASDLFNPDALFMLIKADDRTMAAKSTQLRQTCSSYKKFNDCFGGRWWNCFDLQALIRGGAGSMVGLNTQALAHMSPSQMGVSFEVVTLICNEFDSLDSQRVCIRNALTHNPSVGDLLEKARLILGSSTQTPPCNQMNAFLHVTTAAIYNSCGQRVANLTYTIARKSFSITRGGQLGECGYDDFAQMISDPASMIQVAAVRALPPVTTTGMQQPPEENAHQPSHSSQTYTRLQTPPQTTSTQMVTQTGTSRPPSGPILPPWYKAVPSNTIPQNVWLPSDMLNKQTTAWIPPNWQPLPTTPGPFGWWKQQQTQPQNPSPNARQEQIPEQRQTQQPAPPPQSQTSPTQPLPDHIITTPRSPRVQTQSRGDFPIWFPGATTQPNWYLWWTTKDWWNVWTMPGSWLPGRGPTMPTPLSSDWLQNQLTAFLQPQQNQQNSRMGPMGAGSHPRHQPGHFGPGPGQSALFGQQPQMGGPFGQQQPGMFGGPNGGGPHHFFQPNGQQGGFGQPSLGTGPNQPGQQQLPFQFPWNQPQAQQPGPNQQGGQAQQDPRSAAINSPPGDLKLPPLPPSITPPPHILPTPDWWPAGLTKPPWLIGQGVYSASANKQQRNGHQVTAPTPQTFQFGGNMPQASEQMHQQRQHQNQQTPPNGFPPLPPQSVQQFPWPQSPPLLGGGDGNVTSGPVLQGAGPTIPPWFFVWGQNNQKPSLPGNEQQFPVPSQPQVPAHIAALQQQLPFPQTVAPMINWGSSAKVAQQPPNQPFWWLPPAAQQAPQQAPNSVSSLLQQLNLQGFSPNQPQTSQVQAVVGRSASHIVPKSAASAGVAQHMPNECLTGNDLQQVLRDPGGWANLCPDMRIRCTGLLVEWRFRSALSDHTVVYLSVWRESEAGMFALVGKSEVMATSRGKQTYRPMQSIAVKQGDFLGIFYRDPSRPGVVPYLDSNVAVAVPVGAHRADTCFSFFAGSAELSAPDGSDGLEASRGVKVHRLYDLQAVVAPIPDPIPRSADSHRPVSQPANPRAAAWSKMALNSMINSKPNNSEDAGQEPESYSFTPTPVTTTTTSPDLPPQISSWAPTEADETYDPWTQRPEPPSSTTTLPPAPPPPPRRRTSVDEWLAMIETPSERGETMTTTGIPVWQRSNRKLAESNDDALLMTRPPPQTAPMTPPISSSDSAGPALPIWNNHGGVRFFNKTTGQSRGFQAPPPNSPLYNIWVNEYSWGRNNNNSQKAGSSVDYARSPCGMPAMFKTSFATDIKAEEATYRCYPGFLQVSGNGQSRCDIPSRKWSTPSLVCVATPSIANDDQPGPGASPDLQVVELRVKHKMNAFPRSTRSRNKTALVDDNLMMMMFTSGTKPAEEPQTTLSKVSATTALTTTISSSTSTVFFSNRKEENEQQQQIIDCLPEVSCGETPQVDNSIAELSYRRRYGCEGDSVRYTCLPGYKFSGNYPVIVCSNKAWTPKLLPTCDTV